MTNTEVSAPPTPAKSKKSVRTPTTDANTAPETLFGAAAQQIETTLQALVVDTADLNIAAEETSKLLEHGRSAAADSLTAIIRELTDFTEKSSQHAAETLKTLLSAASPLEAIEIQSRYLMDAGNQYVAHLQRLNGVGVEAFSKAWEPLADIGQTPYFTWLNKAA